MRIFCFFLITFALFIVSAKAVEYSLLAVVTINPIYDLKLEVDVITEHVVAGNDIIAEVKLEKIGPADRITVDLDYSILNMRKQVKATGYVGTINVINEAEKNVTVPIPSDFKPGRYILNITASHPQARDASDYDYFFVSKKVGKGLLEYLLELFKYLKISVL